MTIPASHIVEAQKLTADGYVDLFEIVYDAWRNDIDYSNNARSYIKDNNPVLWQNHTYEGIACKIAGVGNSADEQVSRPTFTIMNPDGVFSSLVLQGRLEAALVIRKRVLKQHIDTNVADCITQTWRVSRVASCTNENITLELRDQLDGQTFVVPARMFIPPEFPFVSLT